MQKIISLIALLISFWAISQAQQPILKVADKDSGKVKMTTLKIDVKILANIAITTMEMEFCNSSQRILEGELTFPLPEGVSINRYAIDINGVMREAVPVEKEKGQVVFENIVRQKVDPGLLEKVEGNNFRTRVYPLPVNGCRKVLVAYQQTLQATHKNAILYNLPLESRNAIPNFYFTINVYSKDQPEIGKACGTDLKFEARKNVYTASVTEKDFIPTSGFSISMPKLSQDEDIVMQKKGNEYYFLVNDYPEYKKPKLSLSTHTHIIWDNSFSGLNRNTKKEIDFVKSYLQQMKNGTISLSTIGYSYKFINTFTITNGENTVLIKALENMIYDGATNLSLLKWNIAASEHLLFTDGLNTYGQLLETSFPKTTLHTITAAATADFSNLNYLAKKGGGLFINLNSYTNSNEAVDQLATKALRLINVQTAAAVSQVYPGYGVIATNIAISGISTSPSAAIELQYGFGNEILFSKKVNLDYNLHQTNDIPLDKIWAQQKIEQLEEQYDLFKNTIEQLGKQYNIVTRNTSLIVLDNVQDYVKYKIPPPQELAAEYKALIAKEDSIANEGRETILNDAKSMVWRIKDWYQKDFSPKVSLRVVDDYDGKPLPTARISLNGIQYTTDKNGALTVKGLDTATANISNAKYISQTIKVTGYEGVYEVRLKTTQPKVTPIQPIGSIKIVKSVDVNTVQGVVVDTEGVPLQSVTISYKGHKATMTDKYGFFKISTTETLKIRASYVGYETREVILQNGGYYQIVLEEGAKYNEEVVVTGYSNARRSETRSASVNRSVANSSPIRGGENDDVEEVIVKRNITSSVTTIKADEIKNVPVSSFDQALAGRVYGTQVNGNSDASANITIRGAGSLNTGEPLYIVNGVAMDAATFKSKNSNEWASVDVLKDAAAVSLYGSRAANGVIIANTKDYKPADDEKTPLKTGFEVKKIDSKKAFIQLLKATAIPERYAKYLELRKDYLYTPSFYFEIANFFLKQNETELGLLILSTVADLNLQDHELYKMLGYQLKKQAQYAEASNAFRKVLEWRPQEPQSYRDYALSLQDEGKHQNALDSLYTCLTKYYDSEIMSAYRGIEETILLDINNIIALQKNVNISKIDKALLLNTPVDVRVVLNWNMNDTDLDLWVIDPRGEKCFYNNNQTKMGGRISDDFTDGYGPEQFILKTAQKGKYRVMLHYYGDGIQKIAGGTTIMAEIFTNYGRPNEVRELITLQLEKGEDREGVLVGEFKFE